MSENPQIISQSQIFILIYILLSIAIRYFLHNFQLQIQLKRRFLFTENIRLFSNTTKKFQSFQEKKQNRGDITEKEFDEKWSIYIEQLQEFHADAFEEEEDMPSIDELLNTMEDLIDVPIKED